ncbi:MAG TPA: hypothetical protein VMH86_08525 [Rhizomicrobium sp.]|nr:hypothetical protein [Rhizomicrobium sp.]
MQTNITTGPKMGLKTGLKPALLAGGLAAALTTGVFIGQALANQPHMEAALADLQSARSELIQSSHNKGGHRVEALRLTNAAIAEVQAGMAEAY